MVPLDFGQGLRPSGNGDKISSGVLTKYGPFGVQRSTQRLSSGSLPRFTNDRFLHVRKIRQFLLVTITLFSDGIHIFGWNFEFPSRAERIVWREQCAEILAGLHRDNVWQPVRTIILCPSQLKNLRKMRAERPPRPQPTLETSPLPVESGASATM